MSQESIEPLVCRTCGAYNGIESFEAEILTHVLRGSDLSPTMADGEAIQ